ncbi:hypothetical protein CBL_12874 [Carabus blaptoides fortunei]
MFQSDDDITFDAEFLSDTFELASSATSVECSKRPSEATEPQSVKKVCTASQNTLDILSLLKTNAEKPTENRPEHRFARPVLPSKKRRVVQRKFPGPAGILPAQRDVNVDLNKLENEKDEKSDSDELVCSQQSEDIFTRPAWRRMLQDLESIPGDVTPDVGLPERYTIAWAKARAARRQLVGGRTPFLAAVVQQIDCSTRNPMAVLKDQTGEIQATLIHELWEEYGEQLHTGAVILLRQVGVLSTAKQHYLAVTSNNLFAIYSDETSDTSLASNSPSGTKVHYMTSSDFIKTLADIRNHETARENDSNHVGLFANAPCTLNDSVEARRDTYMRRDDEQNRLGLYFSAECSKNSAARTLMQAKPLDFTFKFLKTLDDLEQEKPREGRAGKAPKRGPDNKFITRSIWLNNNRLESITGFDRFATAILEQPDALGWIDFSFNNLKEIDSCILTFPNITILYLHGNQIESLEDVLKLRSLKKLKRLTFHGNPVADIDGYRNFVVHLMPQICNLDFIPVVKREKNSPAPAGAFRKYAHFLQEA